jgi:cellulose biosynthesis protein BcsQ
LKSRRAAVASFVSASGGVGKTKLSLMLAYHLSRSGRKVLFIDLDPTAGASLTVFNEDEYDELVKSRKTLSDALEQNLIQKAIVEPSSVTATAKVGDALLDFVVPGERLIRVVDELWKSSSAGLRFKRALESFIPFGKYDFVLVDNAPFFDPRYTALSLHISDCVFIPLRPSLIDLKRTARMLFWLEDEVATMEKGVKLSESMFAVFNQVPYLPIQVEKRFVESFLRGEEGVGVSSSVLLKRYSTLLAYARQLRNLGVKFLNAYVEIASEVERFPIINKLPEKAKGFVEEAANVLGRVLQSST